MLPRAWHVPYWTDGLLLHVRGLPLWGCWCMGCSKGGWGIPGYPSLKRTAISPPKKGWLEYEFLSYWGGLGLFSGVNSLLVFREDIPLDLPPTQDASSKEMVTGILNAVVDPRDIPEILVSKLRSCFFFSNLTKSLLRRCLGASTKTYSQGIWKIVGQWF